MWIFECATFLDGTQGFVESACGAKSHRGVSETLDACGDAIYYEAEEWLRPWLSFHGTDSTVG